MAAVAGVSEIPFASTALTQRTKGSLGRRAAAHLWALSSWKRLQAIRGRRLRSLWDVIQFGT